MTDSFVVYKDCVYKYYGLVVGGKFRRLDDTKGIFKNWSQIPPSGLPKYWLHVTDAKLGYWDEDTLDLP